MCTLHVANEIEEANVAALVGDRPGKLFTDDTANKSYNKIIWKSHVIFYFVH